MSNHSHTQRSAPHLKRGEKRGWLRKPQPHSDLVKYSFHHTRYSHPRYYSATQDIHVVNVKCQSQWTQPLANENEENWTYLPGLSSNYEINILWTDGHLPRSTQATRKILFISGNHFSNTICLCYSRTKSIYSNFHIYSTDFFGIVSKRNAMYCVTIIQTVFASTGLLYYSCNNYYNLLFYSIGCSDHHILANSIVSWCNIPSTYFICHIPYISKSHGLYLRKTSQRHIYIYLYMYLSTSLQLLCNPLYPNHPLLSRRWSQHWPTSSCGLTTHSPQDNSIRFPGLSRF